MNETVKITKNVTPTKCNDFIPISGKSIQVSSKWAMTGYIINPIDAENQGLDELNILYIDPTGPASTEETVTTVALQPGQTYTIPPFVTKGIWANSNADGHKFTAVQIIPLYSLQWKPVPGDFPPKGPTGKPYGALGRPIPSYLYEEYSDDDNLQAFVRAYNRMSQDITDTFLNLELPVYCRDPISGALLDWVGQGIYGMPRPSMTSGNYTILGPYNTLRYNQNIFVYNTFQREYPDEISAIDDDIYRRILTWHYSKGMGKYFSIQWLKKRVMQFLLGVDGKNINIDNTYRVSISFGVGCEVTIRIIQGVRIPIKSAMYNDNNFQYNVMQYNELDSDYVSYPPFEHQQDFKNAVLFGILELPFQFQWDVSIR